MITTFTREQLQKIGKSPFDAVKLGLPLFKYKRGVTPYLAFDSKTRMFVSSSETAITKNHEIYSFIDDCWYDGNPTMGPVVMDDFLSSAFASRMEMAVQKNKQLLNCLNPIQFARFRFGVILHINGKINIDPFAAYEKDYLIKISQSLDNMIADSYLSDEWWGLYGKTTSQLSEKYNFHIFGKDGLEIAIPPKKQKDLENIQIVAENGIKIFQQRRYLLISSFM